MVYIIGILRVAFRGLGDVNGLSSVASQYLWTFVITARPRPL